MKIKIWTAITDGGDGEHHARQYKTLEEMTDHLSLTDVDVYCYNDGTASGSAFDDGDYNVDISCKIFNTDGYEVVE